MRSTRSRGWVILIVYLLAGAILGAVLGQMLQGIELLAGITPYLLKTYSVFNLAPPLDINLYVFKITFGMAFSPNVISIIGAVLAFILFRRL